MDMLRGAHSETNLGAVMCRSMVSVDYNGLVYDCDFNQMLGLPLRISGNGAAKKPAHLKDLIDFDLDGNAIVVCEHCYGCTAGQGSSCGGALV